MYILSLAYITGLSLWKSQQAKRGVLDQMGSKKI